MQLPQWGLPDAVLRPRVEDLNSISLSRLSDMSISRKMHNDKAKGPQHGVLETPDLAYDNHGSKDLVDDDQADQSFASTWKSLWSKHPDLDAIATKRSVFDDEELSKFYTPPADYENAHRFDPSERWTYREEQAVLRKVDFRILLWVLVSGNFMTHICD
jgi:hypothetical protein